MSDSDRQWLAALAGQATPPGEAIDALAQREALALRAALSLEDAHVQARVRPMTEAPGASDARLQRLLQRLGDEGLLSTPGARPAPVEAAPRQASPAPWWSAWLPGRLGWPAAAGLAAVATLAAVLVLRSPSAPPEAVDDLPALRGGAAPLVLQRPDPAAFAGALQTQLRSAGAAARIYRQAGGRLVVDVDVPAEALDAARPALEGAGLPVRAGLTRVEVGPGGR